MIRVIIVLATLLLAFFGMTGHGSGANASLAKNNFVFAVTCGEDSSGKLCLLGKFKAGTKVTFLQPETGNRCVVKTTSRTEEYESSGAYLTRVTGSCPASKDFMVGVLEKSVLDYERLSLTEIKEAGTIRNIEKSIRSSKALLILLEKAQGIAGEIKQLEGITPKVYRVALPGLNMFIASFRDKEKICGPQVVILNGNVYPLTGWCSYPTLNVFRLNGRHYIQSGSFCCDCGITIMELFLITDQGPIVEHSDSSLSD
jgi:hypothetical protein